MKIAQKRQGVLWPIQLHQYLCPGQTSAVVHGRCALPLATETFRCTFEIARQCLGETFLIQRKTAHTLYGHHGVKET